MIKAVSFKRDPMINCHRGVHSREGNFFFSLSSRENIVGILNEERGYGMSDET